MADEKTNPTPKVPGARTDTMHSTPDVPDRSKMDADDLKEEREATAAPSNTGSVGSERPHETVVHSKDDKAGTLVEKIPSLDEPAEDDENATNRSTDETPVGLEDGQTLPLQPGEPLDTDTTKPFSDRQGGSDDKPKAKRSSSTRSSASKSTSKTKDR